MLKLMAATLLADGTSTLSNVPDIADVGIMADLLAAIGVRTEFAGPGRLHMVNDIARTRARRAAGGWAGVGVMEGAATRARRCIVSASARG